MKTVRFCLPVLVLLSSTSSYAPLHAQTSPRPSERIDVSRLGPQAGARVPDFSLTDQSGHTQTLQSIMGPRGAMLVFQRSADW